MVSYNVFLSSTVSISLYLPLTSLIISFLFIYYSYVLIHILA
jgi:hypothetical protein